jgi:hypothetical protein
MAVPRRRQIAQSGGGRREHRVDLVGLSRYPDGTEAALRCNETSRVTQQLEGDDEFARQAELVVWTSGSTGSELMVWLPYRR